MDIADNVLKHHLREVYWIAGSACAGKTTMARALAEKHGLSFYSTDELYTEHRGIANPQEQPAMCSPVESWESFFNQPKDEYLKALGDASQEQMSMIVSDLVRLAGDGPLVVEGWFPPDLLRRVADLDRVMFLCADPGLVRRQYFARQDKEDMLQVIKGLENPEATLQHVLDVVAAGVAREIEEVKASGMPYILRTRDSTIEKTLDMIERQFGFLD